MFKKIKNLLFPPVESRAESRELEAEKAVRDTIYKMVDLTRDKDTRGYNLWNALLTCRMDLRDLIVEAEKIAPNSEARNAIECKIATYRAQELACMAAIGLSVTE